jgi:TPR repeat protein
MSACNQTHDLRVSGVGGARDEAGAVLARLPACKLDPAACVLLAGAWIVAADQAIDGEVTSRFAQLCASTRDGSIRRPVCDAPGERGRVRADRAKCAGGDDAVCTSLGRRLRDMGLHAQAAELLDGACQRGRADACAALVDVRQRGLDLPPLATEVTAKLKAAAKKACEGGDGVACYELAQTEAQGGAAARKALQLLSSKCKQDGTIACRMAADLCEGYGRKLADDPKKAASLRESGCKAGDARACVAAGVQVDQDSEDPQSGEKAGQLFLRACALGEAEGCVRLQRVQPAPSGAVEQLAKACKAGVLDVCAP